MAIYNYQIITDELIANGIIPQDDIFYFQGSPLESVFARYFQFCQENLTERCGGYNIQPAKFYFRNEFGVNASAGKTALPQEYYIVRVNMGTIVILYHLFYERNDIFENDPELAPYNNLNQTLDAPLGFIMFQLATLFTYYHELAHLIQKSPNLEFWPSEEYQMVPGNEYSCSKHILEFDADLNGAHSVCFHLVEYWKRQNPEFQTEENFQRLISIGAASILAYFLLLPNADQDIYYKASTHPHIIVRISYIVDCFIKVAEANLPQDKNIQLNSKTAVSHGFRIADKFFKAVLNDNRIEKFAIAFGPETQSIEEYVTELIQFSNNNPALVRSRVLNRET